MRILYHHRTTGRGAEGNHIMAFVTPAESCGHSVTIVSPPGVDPRRSAGAVPLDKGTSRASGINRLWQLISRRAPQFVFEVSELAYNLYAALRILHTIGREQPSLFYERYAFFLFAGVAAARSRGIPVLLEVNEIGGVPRARRQVFVRLAATIERFVFSRADAIFVVSSYLRDRVITRGARPDTVYVIPNAIDPERFEMPRRHERVRSARQWNNCVVAGFVGWFDSWDRLDILIDACALVVKDAPKLRLLLVGDGPVTPLLRRRIEEHGLQRHVDLTGPVPRHDVPAYIDAMDICVLPDSNLYGSPMVLFEFMASGKAVIAPDLPPIRDVVTNGENGLIIRPGDTQALADALRTLLRDAALRTRLGENARTYVLENRTFQANADEILRVGVNLLPQEVAA